MDTGSAKKGTRRSYVPGMMTFMAEVGIQLDDQSDCEQARDILEPKRDGAIAPEKLLRAQMLTDVILDVAKHHERAEKDLYSRSIYNKAMVYAATNERTWPFSFVNVCESLDIDPQAVRNYLSQFKIEPRQ